MKNNNKFLENQEEPDAISKISKRQNSQACLEPYRGINNDGGRSWPSALTKVTIKDTNDVTVSLSIEKNSELTYRRNKIGLKVIGHMKPWKNRNLNQSVYY